MFQSLHLYKVNTEVLNIQFLYFIKGFMDFVKAFRDLTMHIFMYNPTF